VDRLGVIEDSQETRGAINHTKGFDRYAQAILEKNNHRNNAQATTAVGYRHTGA